MSLVGAAAWLGCGFVAAPVGVLVGAGRGVAGGGIVAVGRLVGAVTASAVGAANGCAWSAHPVSTSAASSASLCIAFMCGLLVDARRFELITSRSSAVAACAVSMPRF